MGGIWTTRNSLATQVGEILGYKSGLALTYEQMETHSGEEFIDVFNGNRDEIFRIRSEEVEALLYQLLYKCGVIDSPSIVPIRIRMFHQYKGTPFFNVYLNIVKAYVDVRLGEITSEEIAWSPDGHLPFNWRNIAGGDGRYLGVEITAIDRLDDVPEPLAEEFFRKVRARFGKQGEQMARYLDFGFRIDQFKNPWTNIKHVEWKEVSQLSDLFLSESLEASYGKFFDQRFINYLSANFGSIDDINWRKFEGLAAEFFTREGLVAEIGPGRNDDNVDIRVWPKKKESGDPLILVQCKRQKEKVGKVVVKALYADVLHENAKSGLIVTSSSLAPGAENVCRARGYPINAIDRETLIKWLDQMRTPFTGVFMGD